MTLPRPQLRWIAGLALVLALAAGALVAAGSAGADDEQPATTSCSTTPSA